MGVLTPTRTSPITPKGEHDYLASEVGQLQFFAVGIGAGYFRGYQSDPQVFRDIELRFGQVLQSSSTSGAEVSVGFEGFSEELSRFI